MLIFEGTLPNVKSAGDISRALADRAEAFCRSWLPAGRKVGNYWTVGNKHGDSGRSLVVRLRASAGRPPGKWVDYATGEYGDLLDILEERLADSSRSNVYAEACRFLGLAALDPVPDPSSQRRGHDGSDRPAAARKLFAIGRPIVATPAERYLRSRGITRFGPALRYHHAVYFRDETDRMRQRPALLAAITDNAGQVTGCARTWLDPATARIAAIAEPKRVIGAVAGNAVRFRRGAAGDELIAGEGIETMLSIGTALPALDICACLTATHLGQFIPPSHLKRLWIARDNDHAGERAANLLRQHAEALGIAVVDLVPRRNDFNDDLREDGLLTLRGRLQPLFEIGRSATATGP